MNYEPKLPEYNDNISQTHPLREVAILLSGLLLIVGVCYLLLGLLIDFTAERISPEAEHEWFKKVSIDSVVSAMLTEEAGSKQVAGSENELFKALKECAEIDYPIALWKVDSNVVNALAIPGGDIIVFSGLTDTLKTENGLAFVLAHELAHFKHRHHLKGVGRGLVLTFLASLITGDNSGLVSAVSSISNLGQARYSQSRESEADATALEVLNCHYGHVGGASEFFKAMLHESEDTWLVDHYFSTHPEVKKRIEQLNTLSKRQGYSLNTPIPKL